MLKRPNLDVRGFVLRRLVALFIFISLETIRAQTIVLHLRNGDRVTGTIVSENTNQVTLASPLFKEIVVPVAAIERREIVPAEAATPKPPPPAAVKPVPPPPLTAKPPRHWAGEAQLGMDALFGQKERQLYFGRVKATYAKDWLKNILDFNVSYGKTDGVLSENRMDGTSKTDFNLGKRLFVYNLGGAGHDEVRKIDLRFEEGPGLGYHLITRSNFVLNVESGANYQAQYFSDQTKKENFYFRMAEDLTWKINGRLTWDEKLEYFPRLESGNQYRARFETNLKYLLLQNLSLNLTVIDQYDSDPANGVDKNDLQIRSSLGLKF